MVPRNKRQVHVQPIYTSTAVWFPGCRNDRRLTEELPPETPATTSLLPFAARFGLAEELLLLLYIHRYHVYEYPYVRSSFSWSSHPFPRMRLRLHPLPILRPTPENGYRYNYRKYNTFDNNTTKFIVATGDSCCSLHTNKCFPARTRLLSVLP